MDFDLREEEEEEKKKKVRKKITPTKFTHLDGLSKTILQGTLKGGRRRGRQRKCWTDSVKEWTSLSPLDLLTSASRRGKNGRESLLHRPHVPPPVPIGHG